MARRFRFSIRSLLILVTVLCFYFGAWELTKQFAVSEAHGESSPLPFVVQTPTAVWISHAYWTHGYHYHFWLFGPRFKLPYERIQ